MRRALLVVGVLAVLAASARTAPDDLGADAGGVLLALYGDEPHEPAFTIPHERVVDIDDLPGPLQPFVRRLLATPATVEFAAFRRRGPGAADAFLASDAALAGATDLAALRAEIAAGTLVEAGRTTLTAESGEPVAGTDLTDVAAPLSSDIESAIGASISYPTLGRIRTGLVARMLPVLGADGAWSVRYRVVVGADADVHAIETVAGTRSTADVQAFSALGAVELREGQRAVLRGLQSGGDGFVVVLRGLELPAISLPLTFDEGWIALPGTLEDVGGSASLGYVGTSPALTSWLDDPLAAALGSAFDNWKEDLPPSPGDRGWDGAADFVVIPAVGACFAHAAPGGVGELVALAERARRGRSPRTVTVAGPGVGRIVVPSLGGHPTKGFLGSLDTGSDSFEVETGCHSCIAVAEWTRREGRGLSFAAVLDGGGGLLLDVCVRVEEERTERTFAARRSLPGHSDVTHDDVTLPFVTTRVLRARTRVPAGGGRVAGEIDVAVSGDARADPLLQPIEIDGRRLWLAPGERVRLLAHHRTPHVVDWGWDKSCGMSFRYPFVSALSAGTHVTLARRDDGSLDVAAVVTRPPNIHDPAFDMQDGVVEVLRQPFLLLETTFPAGDLGSVARGAGCALRIGVPGATRARLRTTRTTAGGESWTVRHAEGARVLFAAGGTWWLPESVERYESNHESGEAAVVPVHRHDGVHLALEPAGSGIARGPLALRSRPDLTSYGLTKYQAPSRSDNALTLLLPDQRVRRMTVVVPPQRSVSLTTPRGLPDPVLIRCTAPSEEDDE